MIVAVPVGREVMSDAIQPGSERHSFFNITVNVRECAVKNSRGQVLCVRFSADSIKNVIVNALHVLFIEVAKRLCVAVTGKLNSVLIGQ